MTVVILHQHFKTPYKGGALRSYYLATALAGQGIKTIVITGHNEANYRTERVDDVDVHYLPVHYDNRFGFFARGISFLKFAWKSARLAGRIGPIDTIYAISVPLTIGLTAIWIKKIHKIPFLFEAGDLWPDAPIQMGFVRNYFLKRMLFALERWIYEQAESVIALSTTMKAIIEQKAPGKLVHLIPNMADIDFFYTPARDGAKAKFIVSYCGALGIANGLDYMVAMAKASQDAGLPVHFILCGEGAEGERLQSVVKRLALSNFTMEGLKNREGVRDVLRRSDAVLVCYENVPILETGCPNKYFDGLAAGKLIIANFGGWIKDEIEGEQCGIAIHPEAPPEFVRKIQPFLAEPELLHAFQQRALELGFRKYSRQKVSAQFGRLFNPTGRVG